MIPSHITKAHIDEAIQRITHDDVPPGRRSRRYCLITGIGHLPPKYVISLAHRAATGKELDSSLFSGGQESNGFLRRLGFDVRECSCGGTVGGPMPEIRFPTVPPAQPGELVRSLRWYVASRLVIEGGFDPDWIRPRPPITVVRNRDGLYLSHDPDAAIPDRRILLGGLKDAKPDVAVTIPTIGPVLALSLEGRESVETGSGGIPELTGKLERTAGACVNVHMMYPALVYGFWHVLSVDRVQDFTPVTATVPVGGASDHGDQALQRNGEPVAELQRYHDALGRLSQRDDIRDAPSHYEACALTLVECGGDSRLAKVYPDYPLLGSLLDYNRMFERLNAVYDRRFVDSTWALEQTTQRRFWHRESPLLAEMAGRGDLLAEMVPRTVPDGCRRREGA